MARKIWVLDTDTKGTGANVVPLEKVGGKTEPPAERPAPQRRAPAPVEGTPPPERRREPRRAERVKRTITALPPGHVRKRATGELGKVQAVDAKAGTVTVRWLKGGSVSTVALSSVTRR